MESSAPEFCRELLQSDLPRLGFPESILFRLLEHLSLLPFPGSTSLPAVSPGSSLTASPASCGSGSLCRTHLPAVGSGEAFVLGGEGRASAGTTHSVSRLPSGRVTPSPHAGPPSLTSRYSPCISDIFLLAKFTWTPYCFLKSNTDT